MLDSDEEDFTLMGEIALLDDCVQAQWWKNYCRVNSEMGANSTVEPHFPSQ